MFNDEKIAALERRVQDLEWATKIYIDNNLSQSVNTIVYLLLQHFKLKCVISHPMPKLEEIGNEKA